MTVDVDATDQLETGDTVQVLGHVCVDADETVTSVPCGERRIPGPS
ncbi:hypothetical protein [Micromonospora chersina]